MNITKIFSKLVDKREKTTDLKKLIETAMWSSNHEWYKVELIYSS